MTRDNDFKRLVRARMSATGERYTSARGALLRHGKEDGMIPVSCVVRVQNLTEEEVTERAETAEVVRVEIEGGEWTPSFADWRKDDKTQPWLVLTEIGGARVLPIAVGPVEATAVAFALHGVETPRPMTHDMLRDVVAALGTAREVRVTELKDKTFFAELIVIDQSGTEQAISCRPSDGIALAVRANIPILVEESLLLTLPAAADK